MTIPIGLRTTSSAGIWGRNEKRIETALTNLVRVLYGRRASFDLLDLVRFAPPPPKPRWVDRRHIADVLAEIPAGSVTRVRWS